MKSQLNTCKIFECLTFVYKHLVSTLKCEYFLFSDSKNSKSKENIFTKLQIFYSLQTFAHKFVIQIYTMYYTSKIMWVFIYIQMFGILFHFPTSGAGLAKLYK